MARKNNYQNRIYQEFNLQYPMASKSYGEASLDTEYEGIAKETFNVQAYKANNPDLAKGFWDDL